MPPIQMLLRSLRAAFLSRNLRYQEGPMAEHLRTHTDRIQPLPRPMLDPIQHSPRQIGTQRGRRLLHLKYTSHNQ